MKVMSVCQKRRLRKELNNGNNKSLIFHRCCLQISYARQTTSLHRILLSRQNRVTDPVYEGEAAGKDIIGGIQLGLLYGPYFW